MGTNVDKSDLIINRDLMEKQNVFFILFLSHEIVFSFIITLILGDVYVRSETYLDEMIFFCYCCFLVFVLIRDLWLPAFSFLCTNC